jgi:hypothetical protein
VEGIVLIDDKGLLEGLEGVSLSIECHNLLFGGFSTVDRKCGDGLA